MTAYETIEELKAALAELESDDGLERFVEGHGLQSRYFSFTWRSEQLDIEYRLPYARVLSDEEEQALDGARISAAIRLAIILLAMSAEGKLLEAGESKIFIEADGEGPRYSIFGDGGSLLDSGEEWDSLAARLDMAILNEDKDILVIWP